VLLIDRFGGRLAFQLRARLIPARFIPARLVAPRLAAWLFPGAIGAAAAFDARCVSTHTGVATVASRRIAPRAIRASGASPSAAAIAARAAATVAAARFTARLNGGVGICLRRRLLTGDFIAPEPAFDATPETGTLEFLGFRGSHRSGC
jgi:hypothetical protein